MRLEKEKEPITLSQLLEYVKTYEDTIFVASTVGGVFGTYPLSRLAPAEWGVSLASILNSGVVPHRVEKEKERKLNLQ